MRDDRSSSPRGVFANLRLPKKLADRLELLREDDELRENLERSIQDFRRYGTSSAWAANSSSTAAAPGKATPHAHPAATTRAGSPPRTTVPVDPADIIEVPMQQQPMPPPLPRAKAVWASDRIERARGHRVRDPLEVSGTHEAQLVRRRDKGRELGPAFRCGANATERERLAATAIAQATGGPLELPSTVSKGHQEYSWAPHLPLLRGHFGGAAGHLESASWVSADFVNTRVGPSTMADAAMLSSHRGPYVDVAKRATGRQRNRAAELAGATISPRELRSISPRDVSSTSWQGIRPRARDHAPEEDGRGQIDLIEMATARSLISTSLASARRSRMRQ